MAILSDSIIKALKSVADVSGLPTEGRVNLLHNIELQWRNKFEVIFIPSISLANLKNATLDQAVVSLYIKDIAGIEFPKLEYKSINGVKHIVGITFPETVKFTFIEDSLGTVSNFCQRWVNSIVSPSLPGSFKSPTSNFLNSAGKPAEVNKKVNSDDHSYYYLFNPDQTISKKNATIVLMNTMGLPAPASWIKLEGLKFQSMQGYEFGQGNEEALEIEVEMSVDNVKLISPLGIW